MGTMYYKPMWARHGTFESGMVTASSICRGISFFQARKDVYYM